MKFTKIDREGWDRQEYFELFQGTTVYMTVDLDVTEFYGKIKKAGLRFYPCVIYCAARVINGDQAFRYAYDEEKNLGFWDSLHPFYTVPRKDNPELFAMKYTAFTENFEAFYKEFEADRCLAETCGRLLCDKALPPNIFGISAVPGLHYSAFSLGGVKEDFIPFLLLGKAEEKDGRRVMPVTGEFSHAVCDGIHIERFFSSLEEEMRTLL